MRVRSESGNANGSDMTFGSAAARGALHKARKGATRLAILAALLGLSATSLTPRFVAAQDAALTATLDRIALETAELRELPPLDGIDDVLLTRDELLAMMPELIAEESDPAELEAETRALVALGLLPEGTDLLDLTIRLMGDQAAGFYDPLTDEMFVLADGEFDGEEYYYSHEIVHALQDAHLDPDDLMEETESDNGDAMLARAALYEGDAVSASNAYLAEHPDIAIALIREAQSQFTELDQAPGAVSVSLVFPYTAGEAFVARLLDDGGWDAVDAAYADMPASTEQILHPKKYAERDRPSAVALPDPAAALGAGWRVVDDDTLGEFQIGLLLADLKPGEGFNSLTGNIALPESARNAAAGWDGDRYALWEDADAGQDVLVWRSVWDTPQDARAFSRALASFDNQRWNGVFNGESPDDVALATPDIAARIVLDGQTVSYVQSPELSLTDRALTALQAAPAPEPAPGPD